MDLDVLCMIIVVTPYFSPTLPVIKPLFFALIKQLKYFNLAESNLDGSLNNSASSSAQPRYAIETCYSCAAGTWSDSSNQLFDKIYTPFDSNQLDFLDVLHVLVLLPIQVNYPIRLIAALVPVVVIR